MKREATPSQPPLNDQHLETSPEDGYTVIKLPTYHGLGKLAADRTWLPRAATRPPTQTTGRSSRIKPLRG